MVSNFPVECLITMEVNLKSKEGENRTLRYFINNNQQKYYFKNLPEKVNFAVYFYVVLYCIILFCIQRFLCGNRGMNVVL